MNKFPHCSAAIKKVCECPAYPGQMRNIYSRLRTIVYQKMTRFKVVIDNHNKISHFDAEFWQALTFSLLKHTRKCGNSMQSGAHSFISWHFRKQHLLTVYLCEFWLISLHIKIQTMFCTNYECNEKYLLLLAAVALCYIAFI